MNRFITALSTILMLSAMHVDAQQMVKLDTDLPSPMFVGTPKNFASRVYLDEANFGKPRPPFYVPRGVRNVAAGMLVTSSEPEPVIGEVEQVTDGDKEGGDGSYVELGFGVQWVQIDLEKEQEVSCHPPVALPYAGEGLQGCDRAGLRRRGFYQRGHHPL